MKDGLKGLIIRNIMYPMTQIASFDVDSENCFTPLCPLELPVPEGHLIVTDLNAQAEYAKYRLGSKDCHSMASLWVDTDKNPQFSPIAGYENLDIRWNVHGVPGTPGFRLIEGLPKVIDYDYFVWKGQELDMHPYGALYHDLHKKLSTGALEWMQSKRVQVVIVGGLATDYCVLQTVLQLLEAGFIVVLNLAACRGIAEETTSAAIKTMEEFEGNNAIIIPTTEDLEKIAVYN